MNNFIYFWQWHSVCKKCFVTVLYVYWTIDYLLWEENKTMYHKIVNQKILRSYILYIPLHQQRLDPNRIFSSGIQELFGIILGTQNTSSSLWREYNSHHHHHHQPFCRIIVRNVINISLGWTSAICVQDFSLKRHQPLRSILVLNVINL